MTKDDAASKLQSHAEELRRRGVARLALFGSVLRGDARNDSDIDILVDLSPQAEISLIDFAELRLRLSEILGGEVDLVRRNALKPHLKDSILSEARDVF